MPQISFIADVMLGKLAKWLRILGFDTEYSPALGAEDLVRRACKENRQILTRATSLVRRADLASITFFVRANLPLEQVRQVIAHYKLSVPESAALTRCLICNRQLEVLPSAATLENIPDHVRNTISNFLTCPRCRRIYWRGTHYHRMQEQIRQRLFHTSPASEDS